MAAGKRAAAYPHKVTAMKMMACLVLGVALLWSASTFAADIPKSPPPPDPPQIILAADSGGNLPLTEVLRLEPGHLLALGVGIAVGAVVFAPYLGAGEVVGVAIGVLSAEIFYRSRLWPLEKPGMWFQ